MATPAGPESREAEAYRRAKEAMERAAVPYAVVGGHAVALYGHRRNTKDIDLLVLKEDAERALESLEQAGFFVRRSDARWIYQAALGEVMVDLIFASCTPRGVVSVTRAWLDHARTGLVAGEEFPIAAPEEIIGMKILAQHEVRPDWWDAEAILAAGRAGLDWERIAGIAAADPVKTLAFLLYIEARHPGEQWYPPEVLRRFWSETSASIQP